MYLTVALTLIFARLSHLLGLKSKSSVAYDSLVNTHSYRLSRGDHQRLSIAGRYFRLATLLIKSRQNEGMIYGPKNHTALFDGTIKQLENRRTYLAGLSPPLPYFCFGRDALGINRNKIHELASFIFLLFILLFFLPNVIFYRKRANYALILLESIEWLNILTMLKREGIEVLWLFSSYEKDVNLLCHMLKKKNIRTYRVPSSNLISMYYRNNICDTFYYTAPFQLDERKHFTNWYVDFEKTLPCFNYQQLLKTDNIRNSGSDKTIGFISSGVWRRKERGDYGLGLGEYPSEALLMSCLRDFLEAEPDLELHILLHPCERENAMLYEKAKRVYQDFFKNQRLKFLTQSQSSLEAFNRINVAVSVYSSANIERLFLGLKTLYFPACFERNPFHNTRISNICALNKEALFAKMKGALEQSEAEFFKQNELEDYIRFGLTPTRNDS